MTHRFKDEHGSVIPFSICYVLAMIILLVMIMTYVSSEIILINIRNTMKNELANIAIRISSDTYNAMREGNLDEYCRTLTDDPSYRAELEQLAISGIQNVLPLTTRNYKIESIRLDFADDSGGITYILTCDVVYYTEFLGNRYVLRENAVELSGRHNLKK